MEAENVSRKMNVKKGRHFINVRNPKRTTAFDAVIFFDHCILNSILLCDNIFKWYFL